MLGLAKPLEENENVPSLLLLLLLKFPARRSAVSLYVMPSCMYTDVNDVVPRVFNFRCLEPEDEAEWLRIRHCLL